MAAKGPGGRIGGGLAAGLALGAGAGTAATLAVVLALDLPRPAAAPDTPLSSAVAVTAPPAEDPADESVAEDLRFDLVRVDPVSGIVTVAGTATARAEVSVLVDGEPVHTARADAQGSFAGLFTLDPADAPRTITLEERAGDGRASASAQALVIGPTRRAQAGGAPPTPVPAAAAPNAPAAPEAVPQPPPMVLVDRDGVRHMPEPGPPVVPEVGANVVVDAISYGAEGAVQLSGRATTPSGTVRLYLDNELRGTLAVDDAGGWTGELPGLDTEVRTLRVDEVDAAGAVISRFETPFRREDPARVAALDLPGASGARAEVITVQPGHSLWAISRDVYGEGLLYVQLFGANRDQIRDPDLIYPGQVLTLPDLAAPR